MSKVVEFQGKRYEVPQDATMDEIDSFIQGSAPPSASAVKGPAPDARTSTEVMQDQAANVLRGIPSAVTGIPGAVSATYQALKDIVQGKGTAKAQSVLGGMVQPAVPILKTAMSSPLLGGQGITDPRVPSPDSPEWAQAAQGAGNWLGGAALQGGIEGIAPALSRAMENSAAKQYTRALAPTTKEMKLKAERSVPELIDQGVTGSLDSLSKQADAHVDVLGKEREAAVAAASQNRINTQPVLSAIDKSLRDSRIVIDDPITGAPKVMNQAVANAANKLKGTIQQFGSDIPVDTLDKVKQYFQKVVSQSGGYSGRPNIDLSKNVMRDAASSIADELHAKEPDIAKIDAQYTVWKNLQSIVDETLLRKSSQGFPLRELSTALAGGSAGYLAHGLGGGAAGAALLGGLALAVKSPLWRTISAVTKDRLADLIAGGDIRTAALLTSRLLASENIQDKNPDGK